MFVDTTVYSYICDTREIQHPLLHSVPNDLLHALVVNFRTTVETLLLLSVNPTALYLGYGNGNTEGLDRNIRDLTVVYDICMGVEGLRITKTNLTHGNSGKCPT